MPRPRRAIALPLALLLSSALAVPAGAVVHPGDFWPNFTKSRLDFPSPGLTTPVSIYDYSGKVVVLFVLGYG
jgi:hypothetical protein